MFFSSFKLNTKRTDFSKNCSSSKFRESYAEHLNPEDFNLYIWKGQCPWNERTGNNVEEWNGICPFCGSQINENELEEIRKQISFDVKNYNKTIESIKILSSNLNNPTLFPAIEEHNLLQDNTNILLDKEILIEKIKGLMDLNDAILNISEIINKNYYDFNEIKRIDGINIEIFDKYELNDIKTAYLTFESDKDMILQKINNLNNQTKNLLKENLDTINKSLINNGIPYELRFNEEDFTYLLCHIHFPKNESTYDNLSYGEHNFISCLLFLLANKDEDIIIDDPISSFDESRRSWFMNFIHEEFKKNKNRTIIVLSHDTYTIKYISTRSRNWIESGNLGKILYMSNEYDSMFKSIDYTQVKTLKDNICDLLKSRNINELNKSNASLVRVFYLNSKRYDEKLEQIKYLLLLIIKTSYKENFEQYANDELNNKYDNPIQVKDLLNQISEDLGFDFKKISNDLIDDQFQQLTMIEKAMVYRGVLSKDNAKNDTIQKELKGLGISENYRVALEYQISEFCHGSNLMWFDLNPFIYCNLNGYSTKKIKELVSSSILNIDFVKNLDYNQK